MMSIQTSHLFGYDLIIWCVLSNKWCAGNELFIGWTICKWGCLNMGSNWIKYGLNSLNQVEYVLFYQTGLDVGLTLGLVSCFFTGDEVVIFNREKLFSTDKCRGFQWFKQQFHTISVRQTTDVFSVWDSPNYGTIGDSRPEMADFFRGFCGITGHHHIL